MGNRKYEYQPIREVLSVMSGLMAIFAWTCYWMGYSHDAVAGLFETSLILIIAAEAYARD